MREWVGIALMVVVAIIAGIASCTIRYDCCRSAGFGHDECVYQTACN